MAKYEIKDAKTANLEEIYFDKNVGKMCYKNAYGIITELETTPPPPGLQPNPTSGYYPINRDGVFVNSGLSNTVAVLPPFLPSTIGSLGLKYYDEFANSTFLELNPLDLAFTFGDAGFDAPSSSVFAMGGISILEASGEMIMNCGIGSPTNGVFRASAAQGVIEIGTSPIRKFGIDLFAGAIRVGTGFINFSGPSNPGSVVRWIKITDSMGETYWCPLYQ